jgi:hypothetical protein
MNGALPETLNTNNTEYYETERILLPTEIRPPGAPGIGGCDHHRPYLIIYNREAKGDDCLVDVSPG